MVTRAEASDGSVNSHWNSRRSVAGLLLASDGTADVVVIFVEDGLLCGNDATSCHCVCLFSFSNVYVGEPNVRTGGISDLSMDNNSCIAVYSLFLGLSNSQMPLENEAQRDNARSKLMGLLLRLSSRFRG